MAPKLGNIRQIEMLSVSEKPSEEGAWWIMLQTAESIINSASLRDPVNNAYMSEFWCDAAYRAEKYLSPDGNCPSQYDDLMQMISFCGDHLLEIVKKPRHNLVKADRMVRAEKIRDVGYKTINWLGKQPGRTVKEKMADRKTILTQKKEYSYDIKENQVTMMLFMQLMRRVSDRINNGSINDAFIENDQIKQMLRIKKLLRESPLDEVKARNHTQPNNVLLSDKNYSIIWRAYMDMSRFDARLKERWEKALELYVQSVFLAINAEFCTYDDLYVIEDRIRLQDTEEMGVSYILGYHYKIPYIVDMKLNGNTISLHIYDSPLYDSNRSEYSKKIQLTFNDSNSKSEVHRGTPLYVAIKENDTIEKKLYYADLSCVKEITELCKKICFNFAEIELVKTKKDEYISNGFTASVSFDIVGNSTKLGISDDNIRTVERFYSDKAVVYSTEHTGVYPNGSQRLHINAKEKIDVKNAVLIKDNRGLKAVLDELCDKVSIGQNDYFFYLVPDALQEIGQRDLKQCIKGCFTRTFPVWRSVAGLTTWLNDPKYKFNEDSIFVYIDLVGDTATAGMMTIHYEEILKNYTCNHFIPFPQNEAGDRITEDAFCESYIRKFAEKYALSISDDAVKDLVEDGIVRNLLINNEADPYANCYFKKDNAIGMYQITYDKELVQACVKDLLNDLKEFWDIIGKRLADNTVTYVYFISDLLFQYVAEDDLKTVFTDEQLNSLNGIFQSDTAKLLEGALIYKDRINNNLPVWTEYLPKLSLKIPIGGTYRDLDLIDENMSINIMDNDVEFPVKNRTPLRLHAGADEYYFELKKEDISRRPSRIEACIPTKGKLEQDVDVNLFIRYKYGSDESYELILRPIDSQTAPFDEIKAEWRSGYRPKKNVGGPKFPQLTGSEEIDKDVQSIKTNLSRTFDIIRRFLCQQYDYARVSEKFKFDQICKFLTINTFKLRETLRYYERNQAVKDLVDWFFESDLFACCVELMTLNDFKHLSADFINDYKGSKEFEDLRRNAVQLIYSFGIHVPYTFQLYFAEKYHNLEFNYKENILFNSLYKNQNNDLLWGLVLELFVNNPYSIISNIRNLSNLCWCDEKLITKLGSYPGLVSEIIRVLKNSLQKMLDDPKYNPNPKKYLSVIEVVLAILRLREDPDFDLLVAGTKEATELADLIRKVDDIMGNPVSRIQLDIKKPEALRNMSDIAYAIDMYLTGNEGVDSIEVLSVGSDE